MGCFVSRCGHSVDYTLDQYWYDREEHLVTVHEPSSVVDCECDVQYIPTQPEGPVKPSAISLLCLHFGSSESATNGGRLVPKAEVQESIEHRRDSGIDVDSCGSEDHSLAELSECSERTSLTDIKVNEDAGTKKR